MKSKPPDPLVLTRSLRDAPHFAQLMQRHQYKMLGCPTIEIVENPALYNFDVLSGYYDWILFNSRYSVQVLFGLLKRRGLLQYFVKAKKICAVGPETARVVAGFGVQVDLVPDVFAAAGIVDAFKRNGISQQQILLATGDRSDAWLRLQLEALGNQCTPVEVYQNSAPRTLPQNVTEHLASGHTSCLAVTSPSAIFNLLTVTRDHICEESLRRIPVASIGRKTTDACRSLGFNVVIESQRHTLHDLAQSIIGQTQVLMRSGGV